MSAEFITALDAEIATLEGELKADPRYRKVNELKRVRDLYRGASFTPKVFSSTVVTTKPKRARSELRQQILDAAEEMLKGRTTPTTTAAMFDTIDQVVKIPGQNPRNNLSAMLSNSPKFVSHGRDGWTLASETPEASDDLLTGSASEASNSSSASPAEEPNYAPSEASREVGHVDMTR